MGQAGTLSRQGKSGPPPAPKLWASLLSMSRPAAFATRHISRLAALAHGTSRGLRGGVKTIT